jgi:multidrug efflux pump subunit AcrA (membrane-fusion protein)
VLLLALALPIWHESASGQFLLEPARLAVVRARVPGAVTSLSLQEGQKVSAGQTLATLTNLPLDSDLELARARLLAGSQRANAAALRYVDLGGSLREHDSLATQFRQLSEMHDALQLVSPISGTVVTPRVDDLRGSYLKKGSPLVEIADLSQMIARIYISEFDLSKVQVGAAAHLQVQGIARVWPAAVLSIASGPSEIDPQLQAGATLKGLNPPHFYLVTLRIDNPEAVLKPGMKGSAKIYSRRRSLFARGWESLLKLVSRKLW